MPFEHRINLRVQHDAIWTPYQSKSSTWCPLNTVSI